MKSAGLTAIERKVSCSSADSASFPFPLSCWPSIGPFEPVIVFQVAGWSPVQRFWQIVVQSFLLLGGIKVTWAHVPAWAQSRHGAVSSTEHRPVWMCGYIPVCMHKVCFLTPLLCGCFPIDSSSSSSDFTLFLHAICVYKLATFPKCF